MIKGYLINGDVFTCTKSMYTPRLRYKKIENPITVDCTCMLQKIMRHGFEERESTAYQWLQVLFSEKEVKYECARSICRVLAFLLNEKLPRNILRHRSTCIYWIEENINRLTDVIHANKIFILTEEGAIRVFPPILKLPEPILIIDDSTPEGIFEFDL